jgi:threonine dehydratase
MGELTFAIARRELEDVVTVSDAQLVEALRFFAERMKMIVEPTGCLSFAAVRHAGVPVRGKRVGVVISGGNVDLARYAELLAAGA